MAVEEKKRSIYVSVSMSPPIMTECIMKRMVGEYEHSDDIPCTCS